jgi:hypothetical protein
VTVNLVLQALIDLTIATTVIVSRVTLKLEVVHVRRVNLNAKPVC